MTSGVKEIVNTSNETIEVTLLAREGSDPQNPCNRQVSATLAAHQKQELRYGDDQNPYLNGIIMAHKDGHAEEQETLRVLRRGDAGSLDNKLNAYNTLEIALHPDTESFSLHARNSR